MTAAGVVVLAATTGLAGGQAELHGQVGQKLLAECEMIDGKALRHDLYIQAAEAFLRSAALLNGDDAARAYLKAGEAFVAARDDDAIARALAAAMAALESAPKGRLAADALVLKGDILAGEGEWGRAIGAWTQAEKVHPSDPPAAEALFKCGRAFEQKVRNADQADATYTAALTKYPRSPFAPKSLMARADLKQNGKKYEDAIADYNLLVKTYPDDEQADDALYAVVDIYEGPLKEYKLAYETAVRFRKQYPHSPFLGKVERIETKTLKYAKEI